MINFSLQLYVDIEADVDCSNCDPSYSEVDPATIPFNLTIFDSNGVNVTGDEFTNNSGGIVGYSAPIYRSGFISFQSQYIVTPGTTNYTTYSLYMNIPDTFNSSMFSWTYKNGDNYVANKSRISALIISE